MHRYLKMRLTLPELQPLLHQQDTALCLQLQSQC